MSVEAGLRSQLRNIEATYGRSIEDWIEKVRLSELRRHSEIVAWLKAEHGLAHGAAHRLALVALDALAPHPKSARPEDDLYSGPKAGMLPVHQRVMEATLAFGPDIEVVPKKGYLSLRRHKQFAMIKPAAKHIDVGLILPNEPFSGRFESAATFNALFTHRVRVRSVAEVDADLVAYLREAYDSA